MPDLLLTHAFFLDEDEKERAIMRPYPPLGLLYLSAYLKREGVDVEVLDATFRTRSEYTARLAASAGGVVGIYTTHMTRTSAVAMIRDAAASGWRVVVGGPDSGGYPEEYLARGADAVVVGEGEATLAELLPALEREGPHRLHDVAGIVFADEGGAPVRTAPRALLDIDGIPHPDRECIDLRRYTDAWRTHHGTSSLNLITARGCAYRCRWCSHNVFGYTQRKRDPLDCADEVAAIVDDYGPDQLWYADDVFTLDHPWLLRFAGELEARSIRVPFETISRADRLMSREVLTTLADMGCKRLWIGSESGSDRILRAMGRGVTADQIRWVTRACREVGIPTGLFLMWGYPGEGLEEIRATVEHVAEADPDVFFTTLVHPIKGTPFFQDVEERIDFPDDWAGATDKDLVVRGTPDREYYRLADRWLRAEVARARARGRAGDPVEAAKLRAEADDARARLERESIEGPTRTTR